MSNKKYMCYTINYRYASTNNISPLTITFFTLFVINKWVDYVWLGNKPVHLNRILLNMYRIQLLNGCQNEVFHQDFTISHV